MRSNLFILLAGLCLGAVSGCQDRTSEGATDTKPNILFLFTDDQSFRAVHALGNDDIQTPNIDRLVEGGTSFTHAFNMGAWGGAVCVASRAMIISGQYVWRAQQIRERWQQGDSLAMSQTWGKLMAGAGYQTYMTGKWHVTAPAEEVFTHVGTVRPGMPRDAWPSAKVGQKLKDRNLTGRQLKEIMPPGYFYPDGPDDNSWSPTDSSFGGYWEGGVHWSEVVKNEAIQFIESATQEPDPFFMYIAFNAPHDPRQAPQEYLDRYPIDEIQLPPNWQDEYPHKDSIGLGPGLRDEALAPFPRTEYAIRKNLQEYYAITTHLDEQIGQILDALEASGRAENTYIFLTADHGLAVGQHGLMGKQNMYAHSMQVPLIITGPQVQTGLKVNHPVYLQDLMPTALEIADAEKPAYVEFHSLLDFAKGLRDASPHYDEIYGCYMDLQRMIARDHYKLIVYPRAETVKLFNTEKDPWETKNLADDPEYKDTVTKLFIDLIDLQEKMGDRLDLKPFYEKTKT